MSETGEHATRLLRAYQAQEKRFVERRFPLEFATEVPALRELYSQSKGLHWNPETDIAWDRFDPSRYDKTTRQAMSVRSEEHTSELQSRLHLVCRLLLEKKK